jgi:hypothetical protein
VIAQRPTKLVIQALLSATWIGADAGSVPFSFSIDETADSDQSNVWAGR